MNPLPITFERHVNDRTTGAVEYAAIVAVLTFVISIMLAAALHGALDAAGANTDIAGYSMFVLLPLVGIALTCFAIKDYRRRAYISVTVENDAIHVMQHQQVQSMQHEEVANVRFVPTWFDEACELELTDHSRVRLPVVVAPGNLIRESLDQSLIPTLGARMAARIANGDSVTIEDSSLRSWGRILWGTWLVLQGLALCITIRFIGTGSRLVGTGNRRVRNGWRGIGGGIAANRDGVMSASERIAVCAWSELESVEVDSAGVRLRCQIRPDPHRFLNGR